MKDGMSFLWWSFLSVTNHIFLQRSDQMLSSLEHAFHDCCTHDAAKQSLGPNKLQEGTHPCQYGKAHRGLYVTEASLYSAVADQAQNNKAS